MTDPRDYPTLADSDWELENRDQDIRGRNVVEENGRSLGVVRDMLVDPDHERIAAVRLDDGKIIPVEALQIRSDTVIARAAGASPPAPGERRAATGEEVRVPIVEEHIRVGKRDVTSGGVKVSSRVVEEPVNQRVVLHQEKVSVERRPVNAEADPAKADGLFEERTFKAREHAEEPIVSKEAVVKEEVVVRKEETDDVVDIDDTVRRTEVDIEDERDRPRPR